MEILYLGGLKQTVYFDTGRLQGYPLCEIDFFHFLIGFSIRDWSIEMWEGFQIPLFLEDKSAFVHLPGQRVSDRKAIEKSSSTKKFREHQMEILYLGGLKQTVYFDTGRLQGYPLCEIDFFHFLIGFSIRDWSIEMWEVLPQKLVTPKKWF